MRKARRSSYALLLVMVPVLALAVLGCVLASSPEPAPIGGQRRAEDEPYREAAYRRPIRDDPIEIEEEPKRVSIEIEGVERGALAGLSPDGVVAMLQAHASQTQQPIIEFLKEHGAVVLNTFWINNVILATVCPRLVPVLLNRFPEIERISPVRELRYPPDIVNFRRGVPGEPLPPNVIVPNPNHVEPIIAPDPTVSEEPPPLPTIDPEKPPPLPTIIGPDGEAIKPPQPPGWPGWQE